MIRGAARIDSKSRSDPLRRRLRRLGPGERAEEAVAFVRRYHRECGLGEGARRRREAEVLRDLRRGGTYVHSREELAYGARVAWRNHARCIGRLYWQSLEVIDQRHVTDPDEIAARVLDHLGLALGDGRIRSMISVFAPVAGAELPAYVESAQILQYAGYLDEQGRTLGDPRNIEVTRIARSLGWQPPATPGMFDLLPVILRDAAGRRLLYEVPEELAREVPITHPEHPALGALGLRWYAVPCVSGMILSIGGIDYPCAPFNGHYMATEIASRNLADENRYDLLARVAAAIGDPPGQGPPLWKDRALLELNRAVLHSYQQAGISMVDHHAASAQYMEFVRREHAAGRNPSGDWPWIVPPQAGPACAVFHLPMQDLAMVPNYYHSRADDGAALTPSYHDEKRSRTRQRWDRLKRRIRNWQRTRD